MKDDRISVEYIERYIRGLLPEAERIALEEKINNNASLKQEVDEYRLLLSTLVAYGERHELKQSLMQMHDQLPEDEKHPRTETPVLPRFANASKIWPMIAVAASVAIFSIIGTLWITQSFETRQTAYYKELRRNVEQIKRSQNRLLADIAGAKTKNDVPSRYAGTGFLISGNGYLATSYHVVKEADSVFVENEKYGRLKTEVFYSNAEDDIAILRVVSNGFKTERPLPYILEDEAASLGENVYTLGFPREDIVFGEGSISASSGYNQNPNAYQVSVPVNPGNSGGPLYNTQGDVVGIISGLQTETSGASFAIKSSVLLNTIKSIPLDTVSKPLLLPSRNAMKHLGKTQQIQRWKEHVFIVRVYKGR